jgi:hypothetical protein
MFQLLVQQLLSYLLACLGLVMLQQLQKEDCLKYWLLAHACRCIMQWIKSMGRQVRGSLPLLRLQALQAQCRQEMLLPLLSI